MVVLCVGLSRAAGGDPPRHAEMQQQQARFVELDQDVFAAPREFADARAVEPLGQHRRKRPAQIGAAQFCPDDAPAGHAQREAAPHGFDFGKLRHVLDWARRGAPAWRGDAAKAILPAR